LQVVVIGTINKPLKLLNNVKPIVVLWLALIQAFQILDSVLDDFFTVIAKTPFLAQSHVFSNFLHSADS
jgi:hypothetical protein